MHPVNIRNELHLSHIYIHKLLPYLLSPHLLFPIPCSSNMSHSSQNRSLICPQFLSRYHYLTARAH